MGTSEDRCTNVTPAPHPATEIGPVRDARIYCSNAADEPRGPTHGCRESPRSRLGREARLPRGPERAPQNHRTVDRVTRILEEVVYSPGMTFAELVRALDAPKSSVHGFIRGLLAKGWLHQERHRFYLGPAVYGLTLASGQIRAGLVTQQDLAALHAETGLPAYLGVPAGDHLIYVAEAGSDPVGRFDAQSNIRRTLLATAGGKALLAERRDAERESYLRRRSKDEAGAGRSVPGGVPGDQEDAESQPMFAAAGSGLRSRRRFTTRPANQWRRLRSSARRSKCSPASRS